MFSDYASRLATYRDTSGPITIRLRSSRDPHAPQFQAAHEVPIFEPKTLADFAQLERHLLQNVEGEGPKPPSTLLERTTSVSPQEGCAGIHDPTGYVLILKPEPV